MARNKNAAAIGYCQVCQKLSYTDRKRARIVARLHHPHKNTYSCPIQPDLFHVGSLAEAIKQGHITRHEFYDPSGPWDVA